MPWPSLVDYTEAIRDYPHISILDPKLKGGNPQRGSNSYLMVYSGGFSTVFPIKVSSDIYALRCWIADIGEAETRYREISNYLMQCHLPYFVDFVYVPEGILVGINKYPITRMEWAEGETLCDFIKHNLQDARCLKTAAVEFQKMVAALHAHQISHGDLQDGNILLKRNGTDVEIKLIDYDSVFVPALRGQPDNIVGVPAYQHPQRIAGGGGANEKVDYFSELVIYLSLLSLAEKPDLWSQFGAPTEKRLLFIAEDFKNPDQSDVFQELENLSSVVKQLASKLKEFCKLSIGQLEPLEAVLPKISPAQIIYDQGLAYLRSNRYNEAVVEFEKAISLDPNYKEAYHALGIARYKISSFSEAKRAAEAALRIDPSYQPARALLDVIKKSVGSPPVPPPPIGTSGRTSTNPNSQASLSTGASSPGGISKPQSVTSNFSQYVIGALAFILLICIVVLAMQIRAKDEYLSRIEILENQLVQTGSKLDAATSSIQTLSQEKEQLFRENQKLRNQLVEQNMVTPTQIATVQQLRREKEELRRRNQKLQNENATLREQLNGQRPPSLPPRQLHPAPLQKIYHNSTPRVRLVAISKNNQGCTAFDRGQYSKAIALFQDAKESDLTSSVVRYNLGSTYLVMKEYIKSRNYLEEAVILNSNFKEAHYNLALTQLRRGYPQEAKKAVQAALNIDRNYQRARELLEAIE